jgi:hypothetical protein
MLRLSKDERHHRQRRAPWSSSTAGSALLERNLTNRFESRIAATSGCGFLLTNHSSHFGAFSKSAPYFMGRSLRRSGMLAMGTPKSTQDSFSDANHESQTLREASAGKSAEVLQRSLPRSRH